MEHLTDTPKSCCSSASSNPEPNHQSKAGPGLNMSSSDVSLMASIDEVNAACGPGHVNPMAPYEKPGYQIGHYVDRFIETEAGLVPVVPAHLSMKDLSSTFFVRCGINRYAYKVAPGIYAVGNPDKNSEVLVTANFKLTFDHLRKELSNIDVWILVLDTKGINVWCAAGEGNFSTAELVSRVKSCELYKIVNHKRLIVPQLGATGVSAKSVKKQSGFKVIYGPIRATDIPAFFENNKKADPAMRQVTFTMYERFILTPVEVQIILKPTLIIALILFILSGFGPGFFSFSGLWQRGLIAILALGTGIFSGAIITPVLLPFVPFRQFALKGIVTGSILMLIVLLLLGIAGALDFAPGLSGLTALFLCSVSISSFLAMNFTGTTPFTSPTGVELEMKRFIPVQLAALVISTGLWIFSAF